MKKSLLTLSLLAAVATASAEEIYIIKDGKLATGVEVLPYEEAADGPAYEDGVTVAGATAAMITPQKQYTETRFYIPAGVDLTKAWNVEIEFYYNAADLDSADHGGANKWQVMDIAYHADTTGGNYTLSGVLADNTFDVKAKDKPGQWNTESQFVYVQPTQPIIKEIIFGWQRQIDPTAVTIGPVYIKNLKFVGEGNKPFYYENFDLLGTVSSESTDNIQTYVVTQSDGVVSASPDAAITDPFAIPGGFVTPLPYYVVQDTDGSTRQNALSVKRLFEDDATDGSGYYDPEILHALDIVLPSGSGRKATGRCGRTFVLIPMEGVIAKENLTLDFIAKWDASRSTSEAFADETDETKLVLPVKYAFVDNASEAATCDLTLATDKLLDGKWTAYSATIPFVAGKKYLALVYDRPTTYSYVVDNVRITADSATLVAVTATATEITAFVLEPTASEKILSDANVVVYPVPATENVTVANEGVESVEVINAAGAVVASANGNTVNVSNLGAGMYIVKAYTSAGVLVAKIVK